MNKLLSAAALAVSLSLAGCASSGVQVSQDLMSSFEKGVTTKSEVIAALGKPNTSMQQADGTSAMIYSYSEYKTRPETFIPFVGAFIGGADSKVKTVMFQFDDEDKLINYSATNSEYGTNLGSPSN